MTVLSRVRASFAWTQPELAPVFDYGSIPDTAVVDIVNEAHRMIEGTIQIGIAADSKATS
jgi:hypothetical protein